MQHQNFLFRRMYLLQNGVWMSDGVAKQDCEYWDVCCTRRLLQLLIYPALQKAQGGHSASSCSHLLSCQLCRRLKSKDVHEAPALSPLQGAVFSQTTEHSPLLITGDRSKNSFPLVSLWLTREAQGERTSSCSVNEIFEGKVSHQRPPISENKCTACFICRIIIIKKDPWHPPTKL